MLEPPRDATLNGLVPYVRERVEKILAAMTAQGYDPVVFEGKRSIERQRWLYGIGRTHSKKRRPVTWTLNSLHLVGKAVDIISKKHGWSNEAFYVALRHEAHAVRMGVIPNEGCHLQWEG